MFARNITIKTVLCLVISASFSVSLFGAAHLGMDSGMDGQMGPCPLMPGVAICNMTPLQHMAAAQSMFNTLPQEKNLFALLMLLLATAIAFSLLHQRKLLFPTVLQRFGLVLRREDALLFRPLQEAFSNGIIHSRAF